MGVKIWISGDMAKQIRVQLVDQ